MEFIKREFKLFVLSGCARSGKDTVSKLIEEYYKDKKSINISYGHYIKDYVKRISGWDGSEDTKPRELLQQIGIELIKNKVDEQYQNHENDNSYNEEEMDDIEHDDYY